MKNYFMSTTAKNDESLPIAMPEGMYAISALEMIDKSGSMTPHVDAVNRASSKFLKALQGVPEAKDNVYLGIYAFNDHVDKLQDFMPISASEPVTIEAGGGTDLKKALSYLIDRSREQSRVYHDMDIQEYVQQWIIITDGYGGDISSIAPEVRKRIEDGKTEITLLAPKGFNPSVRKDLGIDDKHFMALEETDFDQFYARMAKKLKVLSESAAAGNTEIDDDLDAWMNK